MLGLYLVMVLLAAVAIQLEQKPSILWKVSHPVLLFISNVNTTISIVNAFVEVIAPSKQRQIF
jgi:hypothetical protein